MERNPARLPTVTPIYPCMLSLLYYYWEEGWSQPTNQTLNVTIQYKIEPTTDFTDFFFFISFFRSFMITHKSTELSLLSNHMHLTSRLYIHSKLNSSFLALLFFFFFRLPPSLLCCCHIYYIIFMKLDRGKQKVYMLYFSTLLQIERPSSARHADMRRQNYLCTHEYFTASVLPPP